MFLAEGENPLGHVVDRPLITTADGAVLLTMHMVTLFVAAGLMLFVMFRAARSIKTGDEAQGLDRYVTKGRVPQMVESLCVALRDQVVRPQLGGDTNKFMPFLWTLFFFILFNNLLGLVPLMDLQHLFGAFFGDSHFAVIGGTATGNLAVTAALAIIALVVIQVNGIRSLGVGGWAKHLFAGVEPKGSMIPVAILMVVIELVGVLMKPFALAVRLFANMVAGHTLLATILMFTGMASGGLGFIVGSPITLLSIFAAIALMFLELFVAFLQAFIFMFLTTVFIAQLSHHDHEPAEAHGEDQPAIGDRAALATA